MRLGGKLEVRPLDDRIHRAGLLAIAAIDAFRHVDVVTRRPPTAILAGLGLDRDRECRTYRLAQLAGDAALLTVGVTPQRVLAAKAGAERTPFEWVVDRDRAFEHVAQGQRQPRQQLAEQQAAGATLEK